MSTPYKTLMIISLIGLTTLFYLNGQNERYNRLNAESEVRLLKEDNNALKAALSTRDSIIRQSYNQVKRIEYLLHSDTLDGVVTYKEKLLASSKGVQRVNHLDLR